MDVFAYSLQLLPQVWCEAVEKEMFVARIEELGQSMDGFNNYNDKYVKIDTNYGVSVMFRCFPLACR